MKSLSARRAHPANWTLLLLATAMLCTGCGSESAEPVTGAAHGHPFALERAEMNNDVLTLHGADGMAFFVFLFLEDGEAPEGRSVLVEQASFGDPHIHMHYRDQGQLEIDTFMKKYKLNLELGRPDGDRLPGRISLQLPDEAGSAIEGSFVASYNR